MDYRMKANTATQSLRQRILAEIDGGGPMRVDRYVELALYDPQEGYYATGIRRVGKGGDFFTSVSVGAVFGGLLARRMVREFDHLGRPGRWRIMELGANDGRLAADVLDAMAGIDSEALAALEYVICEPLPSMREVQRDRLAGYSERVRVVSASNECADDVLPGIVFGNEVLDALPFHWVEWCDLQWWERRIGVGEDGRLQAVLAGHPEGDVMEWLSVATEGLDLPDGWRCEVRTCWRGFLESFLVAVMNPLMIWIDYGFLREELVVPHRSEGTWRAYRRHRIEIEPWDFPGECDLTAHVDFTGVCDAVESLGGRVLGLQAQGMWLTRLAAIDLASREGMTDPAWVRQFQTLTHPAHLGAKFHVLECTWEDRTETLPTRQRSF